MGIYSFAMDAWKQRRSSTIKIYILFGIVFGFDNSVIPITMIPYLQQLAPTEKVNYFYSLSWAMFYASSTIAAMIVGRIVDRTRNVKYSLYFVLTCSIVGQLIYTVRVSPYIIVTARTICGTLSSELYVLRGEIIRCFDEKEASKVLWWYTAAGTVGQLLGALSSLAFAKIAFQIGYWEINSDNFGGLFMALVCLIEIVCVYLYAYDCSKEYDLKSFADREKANHFRKKQLNEVYSQNADDEVTIDSAAQTANTPNTPAGVSNVPISNKNIFKILHGFIRSPDILLMMSSTLLFAGIGFVADLMSSIIVLEIFKWKPLYLNITFGATAVGTICSTLFLARYGVTGRQIYNASILTIILSFISVVLLLVIVLVPTTVKMQILLTVLYTFAKLPIWNLDLSLLPNMLGRVVRTDVQSFAESCRSVMSLTSVIVVGAFIAADLLKYLLFGVAGLCIVSLCIFVHRRERIVNLKLVNL